MSVWDKHSPNIIFTTYTSIFMIEAFALSADMTLHFYWDLCPITVQVNIPGQLVPLNELNLVHGIPMNPPPPRPVNQCSLSAIKDRFYEICICNSIARSEIWDKVHECCVRYVQFLPFTLQHCSKFIPNFTPRLAMTD